MPVLHPAEPWKRSGRYGIDEMFYLQDRRGAEMVLAMTHEEIVTGHVAQVVRSYRDLPLILYHIQVKERDEPRPRAGVLRTREFIMKDSYSFDRDEEGLEASYAKHARPTSGSSTAPGSSGTRVESRRRDDGRHRPRTSTWRRAPRARTTSRSRPATPRTSRSRPPTPSPSSSPRLSAPRGGAHARPDDDRGGRPLVVVPAGALLKAFPVVVEDRGLVLVVLRGDHRVNEIKLRNHLKADFRPAREDELAERIGPGRLPRPGRASTCRCCSTTAVGDGGLRRRRQPPRPPPARRRARPGLPLQARRHPLGRGGGHRRRAARCASSPRSRSGTSSSSARATPSRSARRTSTPRASRTPIVMGCYGIGPARIAAAAVEQFADEQGISWPRALAPWDVELVGLGRRGHGGAGARRAALRGARARRASTSCSTTATPARARSSPTPSCSAARCGSPSGRRSFLAASSRCRSAAGGRTAPCRSTAPRRRCPSCGAPAP